MVHSDRQTMNKSTAAATVQSPTVAGNRNISSISLVLLNCGRTPLGLARQRSTRRPRSNTTPLPACTEPQETSSNQAEGYHALTMGCVNLITHSLHRQMTANGHERRIEPLDAVAIEKLLATAYATPK